MTPIIMAKQPEKREPVNMVALIDRLVMSWCDHSGVGLSQHQLAVYNEEDRASERMQAREALEKGIRQAGKRAVLDALSRERNQN
jgi:hypothetical protein